MGRNTRTEVIEITMTKEWRAFKGTVDEFMHQYPGAFDFQDLHDYIPYGGLKEGEVADKYASFHTSPEGPFIFSHFYWASQGAWGCKC